MRILLRTSRLAIWSRRIGSFAVPLVAIPVFMHRERAITTETFHLIESLAAGLAGVALLLGLAAFVRLWFSGDRGWGYAVVGTLLSALCLAPFAYGAVLALNYPPVSDVSTESVDPPTLLTILSASPASVENTPELAESFPNLKTRIYPVDVRQVFTVAAELIEQRRWEVAGMLEPRSELDVGSINAEILTLLGWRDEVALRVSGEPDGSAVSVRSASSFPGADLGANGNRIESFLADLDEAVESAVRDAPAVPVPEGEGAAPDTEEEPAAEAG